MYAPAFTHIDEDHARGIVATVGSGWLVTATSDLQPAATLMPILWHDDRIIAHMAKANPHWRTISDGAPALLIVTGPEAYISPSWYPTKAEHGRVVPTWNYTAVHLTGTIQLHHDPTWKRQAVTHLTDRYEAKRANPWHVTDAPDAFINTQLNAIVGIELHITHVDGKAKLSQNRTDADQRGVVEGLRGETGGGASEVSAMMASNLDA